MMLLLVFGFTAVLLTGGCGVIGPTSATVTPTLTLTPTFPPTLTPTPLPLGSPENPYVIGLVSETEDPQITAAAGELAQQIAQATGKSASGRVFISYRQMLESMEKGQVHAAWLPPLTYLYASERNIASVVLLTNHFGVYQYGTQFMANVNNGFTPFYDPISGLSSADAATALQQFQGLRPCWVEPQSASGYILPAGLMQMNNYTAQAPVMAQSHTAIVRALYIKGICDFGASFSISGDPRTASNVQQDLPDAMNRVLIIWRSDASIPNVNLSVYARMPEGDRQTLTNAFMDISKTPEGKALLSLSAGNYQIEEIKTVNDDIYNPLRDAVKALEYNLRETIGK
jgi:phosphonate transport system substrate-binding protein